MGEPPENLPVITRDMDPKLKRDINAFGKTHYKNNDVIYGLKRNDRRRHMSSFISTTPTLLELD
ncbi:hypothetical protein KKD03_01785 [Patescibacteria group bacterium]|nr:hypothetical protein [Patescibacteria group bacterium]